MKRINNIALAIISSLLFTACVKDYNNPATGVVANTTDIFYVRSAYKGTGVNLTEQHLGGARYTSGVVISDNASGNNEPGTFVMQSVTASASQAGDIIAGIVVDMGTNATVPSLGDSIRIDILGANIDRKNGRLVLSGITADKINTLAVNSLVIPQSVTLGMLNYSFNNYESTLVAVHSDVVGQSSATVYSGELILDDHTATATLHTRAGSTFASNNVPANAQFIGIAAYNNATAHDTAGAKKTIIMRNSSDVKFASGVIYPGYPENFESPDASAKSSYNVTATANNIDLSTGNWKLTQAILGNTILSDKMVMPGLQSVRMQQNLSTSAYVQMNFDVTQGASKVTIFYGRYGSDPKSTFRLEYSINGGTSWVTVTPNISELPDRGLLQATWMLNLTGNVRFRINKLGLGTTGGSIQNGRLNIDDFVIYKK
jgi:hypothetical protein